MTLLLLFAGADFEGAPVVPDAAGFAFPEEVMLYGVQLEEIPLYAADEEESIIYGSQLEETR